MEYLSNGILELEISPRGAELQSVRRVTCPMEYLWQGDATYWDRRSPVLFPNVGKVWQNTTHVNGQPYTLYQHGFLRDMVFKKIADEDRHLAFICCADDESRNVYPFDFLVRIDYRLLRNVITVEWTVENKGDQEMPFQIGAHPGFNYPHFHLDDDLHGFLSSDAASPWSSTRCDGGFTHPDAFDVEVPHDGLLPLTNETFRCDTILEMTGRMHRITLHDKDGKPFVTIRHKMPITAIWSPCDGRAPFICIEPWEGCCDPEGYVGEFSNRHFTHLLQPGQQWHTSYDIIIE